MFLETRQSPRGSGIYVTQAVIRFDHRVTPDRFTAAWLQTIAAFPMLSREIVHLDEEPYFRQSGPIESLNIEIHDWRNHTASKADEFFEAFLAADRRLGFSLETAPVFRLSLLLTAKDRSSAVFSLHKLLADTPAMVHVLNQLLACYAHPDRPVPGSPVFPARYEEIPVQRPGPEAKAPLRASQEGYTPLFKEKQCAKGLAPGRQQRREDARPMTTASLSGTLPRSVRDDITAFCTGHKLETGDLLIAAWAITLSLHTGRDDIFLGHLYSGAIRSHAFPGQMSVVPKRCRIRAEETLLGLAARLRTEPDRASRVDTWALAGDGAGMDTARTATEVLFSCFPIAFKGEAPAAALFIREWLPGWLHLYVNPGKTTELSIHYDRRRFSRDEIQGMLDSLQHLLSGIASGPAIPVRQMARPLLPPEVSPYPPPLAHSGKTLIHQMVRIQASVSPDAVAAESPDGRLRFRELLEKTNQVMSGLRAQGAVPGCRVAVCINQCLEMLPAILGVMGAGGICVPVNPDAGGSEQSKILAAAAPDIIIRQGSGSRQDETGITLSLDRLLSTATKTDAVKEMSWDHPAFIFFGAKDTGTLISHRAMISHVRSYSALFDIQPHDRLLQFAPAGSETMVQEILVSLFSGSTLIIIPGISGLSEPDRTRQYRRLSPTVLNLPDQAWQDLAASGECPETIRTVIVKSDHPRALPRIKSGPRLFRIFGVTEATCAMAFKEEGLETDAPDACLNIGRPFPGVRIAILNHLSLPALPGTPGQMYIGGVQTATGYLNQDQLTMKQFVPIDPQTPDMRFFKTEFNASTDGSGEYRIHLDDHARTKARPAHGPSGPLNTAGTPPVVLIGNSAGAARAFQAHIPEDLRFHHISLPALFDGLDNGTNLSLDLRELARRAAREISRRVPHGPVILIGECLNAILAQEVACQMEERTRILVLLDESFRQGEIEAQPREPFLSRQWSRFRRQGIMGFGSLLWKRLAGVSRKAVFALDPVRERICRLLGHQVPEHIQFRTLESAFHTICQGSAIRPGIYKGPALLFYSAGWKSKNQPVLNAYCSGEKREIHLKTGHAEWFQPEQVRRIIWEITHFLNRERPAA